MYTQLRGPPAQESRGLNLPAYQGKIKTKIGQASQRAVLYFTS